MALSEGLKGFVNFFTKSFNDGNEDDAFMDLVDRDGDYDTDGTLALDTMYGTRVNNKPERSFERESKVVSHPNSYKSGEVTVIEPRSFSESVKEVDGFEVVEEVVLGHFSFNKYLMWKDLIDRTDAMMEHPLVASLIDKTKKMPEDGDFVEPKDLDELYKPQDFFAPLPMDSSQLAVLAAADKGKSFVIEGPPGTGKSQTISNLIAHLMTKGKTVLFVSEKMAALEVVYRRLEQIGLGRFCLQLHSNKANKRDVLNQLKLSWDNANTNIENNWLNKSGELLRVRNILNETVKALHTPGSNGLTPYYAMGVCIRNSSLADLIQFNWNSSSVHSADDYSLLKELVHKIKIQAESCRSLFGSKAFNSIINNNWEPVWQQAIVSESKTLSDCCIKLDKISQDFKKAIDINIEINDINIISSLYELAQILKDSSLYTADYAFNKNGMEKIESLENAITHLTAYINAKEQLHCICPPDIWKNIDGQELVERWNLALQKWFLPAFIDKFSIKKELKKAGAKGNIVMPEDAKTIAILKEHGSILQELDRLLNDVRVWKIENSSVKDLEDSANLAKKLRQISAKLATNPTTLNMLREKLDTKVRVKDLKIEITFTNTADLNRILEMPSEITSQIPRVTNLGFKKMMIENYKNILEYQDFFIRINTCIGIININGLGMKMEEMTKDDIVIEGEIDSVDFEKIEE